MSVCEFAEFMRKVCLGCSHPCSLQPILRAHESRGWPRAHRILGGPKKWKRHRELMDRLAAEDYR